MDAMVKIQMFSGLVAVMTIVRQRFKFLCSFFHTCVALDHSVELTYDALKWLSCDGSAERMIEDGPDPACVPLTDLSMTLRKVAPDVKLALEHDSEVSPEIIGTDDAIASHAEALLDGADGDDDGENFEER